MERLTERAPDKDACLAEKEWDGEPAAQGGIGETASYWPKLEQGKYAARSARFPMVCCSGPMSSPLVKYFSSPLVLFPFSLSSSFYFQAGP